MHRTAEEFAALLPDASSLYSDEPPMESSLHYQQLMLLVSCLTWFWGEGSSQPREDFFIGANMSIYFSRQQLKNRDFRGPDFFLVKDTSDRERVSWVVWEEDGKYPNLIIELLSDSTAENDRTLKKELYQTRFRTPEYFYFDPQGREFKGFRLVGNVYEDIETTERNWRWSQELELYLGVDENQQLRFFTASGERVPTPAEAAILESQKVVIESQRADAEAIRADAEAIRAATESQRADAEAIRAATESQRANAEAIRADAEARKAARLAAKLKELGIDVDEDFSV
jgi:Uma2 family endonuclease